MKAKIYKIERLNTHNGPGFRTVLYFKGCPLHCTWCHNPEGISPENEIWLNHAKCIGCGTCIDVCPEGSLSFEELKIVVDRNTCNGCYKCAEACPSKAIEKIGEDYTLETLMKLIKQDKILFESSGGGVTATGGDPGMQIPFIKELFELCSKEQIPTAFDTSGMLSISTLEKILPYTNLLYLDLKILTKHNYKKHTGLPIEKIMEVFSWLNSNKHKFPNLKVEVRTPLVPDTTDSEENLITIGNMLTNLNVSKSWELCMFNDLCADKYSRLGKHWNFVGKKHTKADYNRFLQLKGLFPRLNIQVTGFYEDK